MTTPTATTRTDRATVLLCFLALSTACSPSQPPNNVAAAPQPKPKASVPLRSLAAHIPSGGLRWLVELKPRALSAHPEFRRDWEAVFATERISAFTKASGADPKQISEAWIAGYDLGQLYIFDAKVIGDDAEKAFESRSMTTQRLKSDYANVVHMTGIIENTPHALVHVRGHLVAIASGDIRLARIVRAYAEGKLEKSPPALGSRFLSIHSSFAPDALVRGFLRGPYEDATDAVAATFVSGVGAVRFEGADLRVSAQALGVWAPGPDLDAQLTRYADELLSTRELRAFGWGFPTRAPRVACAPSQEDLALCSSEGVWDSGAIASALRRITAGSMKEIVDESPPGWHSEATTEPSPSPKDGTSDAAPPNK